MTVRKQFAGKCPCCSNPIEPGNVITCARCWGLVPAFHRHILHRWYSARNSSELQRAINKVVPIVKRLLPKTLEAGARGDPPKGAFNAAIEQVNDERLAKLYAPELVTQPEQ